MLAPDVTSLAQDSECNLCRKQCACVNVIMQDTCCANLFACFQVSIAWCVSCSGPVYAAVGTVQETVFPLDGDGEEEPQLRRKAWTSSYDSLPSSAALDDGLDPQPQRSLDR